MQDENKFNEILKQISPGTAIRDGLENILKARTGALLLICDDLEIINSIADGGFIINDNYSPAKLYELAKMDGAIILSKDFKTISRANCQLIPSYSITTTETGTRHRTAQRVAIQTGELVICISQRRNIITLFQGENRYILEDTEIVLNKANQAIRTLERYKSVYNQKLKDLNVFEFNDMVTLENVIVVLQRIQMVKNIMFEINAKIDELGTDGRLVQMQLQELTDGIDLEEKNILLDYFNAIQTSDLEQACLKLNDLTIEELKNNKRIAKILGYEVMDNYEDVYLTPRGYRVLSKVPRIPFNVVENIIKRYKDLNNILETDMKELDKVEGVGEIRAKNILSSIKRLNDVYSF